LVTFYGRAIQQLAEENDALKKRLDKLEEK